MTIIPSTEPTVGDDAERTDAASDRAVYLAHLAGLQSRVDALQAESWRLISEKAARNAPPDVWLPLKAASFDSGYGYERVRAWCAKGIVVSEKKAGRVRVCMNSLAAHDATLAAERRVYPG
jgi:hypothetical protein